MKKFTVIVGMVLTLGLAAGCGSKEAAGAATEATANAKSVVGIIDEVTDLYFSIQAEDGTYYQFPFTEENNIDLGEASIGDKIKLYYDGELSDVDAFDGVLVGSELLK
ncbi:MAG: hypothetical protein IKW28_02800 [Lachnospiraceae bacterium]|nr:hypothetical protein [Lachnospiraceae bacterium]